MKKLNFFEKSSLLLILIMGFLFINNFAVAKNKHKHCSSSENCEDPLFPPKAFKGVYAFYGNTGGGVDGTSGVSASDVGLIELYGDNTGVLKMINKTVYTGPIGTEFITYSLPEPLPLQIIELDPYTGYGKILIPNYPTIITPATIVLELPFVAISNTTYNPKSRKKKHAVVEIFAHLQPSPLPHYHYAGATLQFFFKKQSN